MSTSCGVVFLSSCPFWFPFLVFFAVYSSSCSRDIPFLRRHLITRGSGLQRASERSFVYVRFLFPMPLLFDRLGVSNDWWVHTCTDPCSDLPELGWLHWSTCSIYVRKFGVEIFRRAVIGRKSAGEGGDVMCCRFSERNDPSPIK